MYITTMKIRQKIWLLTLLLFHFAASDNGSQERKDDLVEAEAKDGLEIIKTIKKINDDGSYTIGYEADDGSFKIESRDVLGHVKGTYGYIDDNGEIKRVTYSTNNLNDTVAETPSVVQRIPKSNKTHSAIRRPGVLLYNPTTPSPPSSTSAIQIIAKKRTTVPTPPTTTSSTTKKPEKPLVNTSSNIVYASSVPSRNLIYSRPILRSTIVPHIETQKSEGQIIRPEVVTGHPTNLPVFRRLSLKSPLLENDISTIKPVTEEPELRSNLLRRQLNQEKTTTYNPHHHLLTLQQSLGDDTIDVYSASLTTGTPRPLFTTTSRPRIFDKTNLRYQNSVQPKQQVTTEYAQESTTTEVTVSEASTESPTQSPETPSQPLVAIRHPFHGGVVLVPLNQLRVQQHPPYLVANTQLFRPATPTPIPTNSEHVQNAPTVFIPRPPVLRSIPVHVDENGFIRPLPTQYVTPTPYPIPIPITPPPKYTHNDVENEVDSIKPPVSTKDFQKIIEYLIVRQKRLERVNALINAQRQREIFLQNHLREAPQSTPIPIFERKPQELSQHGPVTFIPEPQPTKTHPYVTIPHTPHQTFVVRPQEREVYVQQSPVSYAQQPASFTPTKRVARLLPQKEDETSEEYLPPQIREMLLLRMLQLAINPALPLEDTATEEDNSVNEQQFKRVGTRNVEVLGEEEEEQKMPNRNRRYRGNAKRYE